MSCVRVEPEGTRAFGLRPSRSLLVLSRRRAATRYPLSYAAAFPCPNESMMR
jgi:hypothetical protein